MPLVRSMATIALATSAALMSLAGCRATESRPVPVARSADARFTYAHGGIIRGPRDTKRIALIFTGGSFGEGTEHILDEFGRRGLKASFFVTGDFIRTPEHRPLLRRMIAEGHYLGPHSDAHLLYCSWEDRRKTLVTREQSRTDLEKNLNDLAELGASRERMRYFVPPYEWYNEQIVGWAAEMGLAVVNFTPGTRSNADHLPDADPRFVASERIHRGILEFESSQPDGLSGFLLLLHVGVGPERTDKMHVFVGPLLDELTARGYRFVPVDALLAPAGR